MPCSTSQALRTLVVQPLTGGGIARQVETLLASLRSLHFVLCRCAGPPGREPSRAAG
jgi:hypothetical protein